MRAVLVLKVVSLLRYLNFDFKPTLTAFFDQLSDSFRPTGVVWHAEDVMTEKGSRGKLDRYKIGVGVWRYLDVKMYIYLTSFAAKTTLDVISNNFRYRKDVRMVTTIIQRVHLSILALNSIDYLFYGVHTILHASTEKVATSGYTIQYMVVILVCSLIFIDYMLLF